MRKFYNIENGEIITLDQLKQFYFDSCENWEYSFNEYINNCTSKNGSLEEIKPFSESEKQQIEKSANDLYIAYKDFVFSMRNVTEESFNANLCVNYPFCESFDETLYTLSAWLDSVKFAVYENRLEKH